MKIVYIGTNNTLAETLTERMGQEGHDVYLLSDKALPKKGKILSLYRFYQIPQNPEDFGALLRSFSPDCVIFAGTHYIHSAREEESDADITLLAQSLRTAAAFPHVKFILLSSTEVYGNTGEKAGESAKPAAVSERGIRFLREEELLDIFREQHGMDTVILRAAQLYTSQPKEGGSDFLSRSFSAAAGAEGTMVDDILQPLHVSDFVDAVKRVMDSGTQPVYNVCGGAEISAKRMYQLIRLREKLPARDIRWERPDCVTLADSSRIRQELGWRNFRNLEEQLQGGGIKYVRASRGKQDKKKRILPAWLRQLMENLLIFGVFAALHFLCGSHDLFSQIDWLMIYVILIAVSYNIHQGILAAVLASAACLYSQSLRPTEAIAFYSYAGTVLTVMKFVFLGLVVSYTTNSLREDVRSVGMDLEMLKQEYEDLKAINRENVLIKNEYEQRLLTTKSGFPRLYSLVRRLMVQEPDRIFMETIQVISELVHTDTVAIYQGQAGSTWLRLVGALSDDSAMGGKSWNLAEFPKIHEAVAQGELYQGAFGSGEPAAVLPIVCQGIPEAVILIKTLPFESESLYHVNLLRTMSLMLRDAIEKALQYEALSREDHYVGDTDILRPEAFRRRVALAREKAEKRVAEYCVAELTYTGSLEEAAGRVSQTLRMTDCLGTDEAGRLFALLNNTDAGSLAYLQKRLSACGVEAHSVPEKIAEPLGEAAPV